MKKMTNISKPLLIGSISVVALLLLGGGTVYASDSSKPGDLLYPIDLATESVQYTLTTSEDKKDEILTENLDEREEEIAELEKEDKVTGLDMAIENMEKQREKIQERLEEAAQSRADGDLTEAQYNKRVETANKLLGKNQERTTKFNELKTKSNNGSGNSNKK